MSYAKSTDLFHTMKQRLVNSICPLNQASCIQLPANVIMKNLKQEYADEQQLPSIFRTRTASRDFLKFQFPLIDFCKFPGYSLGSRGHRQATVLDYHQDLLPRSPYPMLGWLGHKFAFLKLLVQLSLGVSTL
jgi:hypothetical protein